MRTLIVVEVYERSTSVEVADETYAKLVSEDYRVRDEARTEVFALRDKLEPAIDPLTLEWTSTEIFDEETNESLYEIG